MNNNNYINRENVSTKIGFGNGIKDAAISNNNVIGLGSDITSSVGMNIFKEAFPDRFYSLGIAEQNAIGIAAGMALSGLIPVFSTYAVFASMRTLDQIRISLCYNNLHVIIGGAHSGISVGPDGATHQALEDISTLRALPNMTIISPCDATQTKIATKLAIEELDGPVYIRFGREPMPDFSDKKQDFSIGKAQRLTEGTDIAIIASGHLVWESLEAAKELKEKGVDTRVINMHTIKPIDKDEIILAAKECNYIITAEEHQITGGLGSAVAEIIVKNHPCKMDFIGMPNTFGESGLARELMDKYGMNAKAIVQKVLKLIE
ncbi:MAG: transketolase family protein [Bacteroidetes bacterium]|nr:MAG: transketolase family protein [Bacteroidota bacterium]